jgi:nucleotide-binding universal stress UspA family protein
MALETVLLALGHSDSDRIDALVDTVVDLAGPAGATVVLAHVFTEDEFEDVATRLDFDDPGQASPEEVARKHAIVRDVAARLEDADIAYRITSRIGDRGDSVVAIAEEVAADLVVVGGRRRSPTGKAVFGSTAQHVLLESPAPVTFVRAD